MSRKFSNPTTRVTISNVREALRIIFPDSEDVHDMFESELFAVWEDTVATSQAPAPAPMASPATAPMPTSPAPSSQDSSMLFPKLVHMVLDKNIRLYLQGCKVHLSQAGIISLVSPIFGMGYYGTFSYRDGRFTPRKECKPEFIAQLRDIEDNGIEAAKRIGLLTGTCCICGRTLTNEGSIEAGIGPICAGKAF